MSLSRYRYRHNGHAGTLYLGRERDSYQFQTEDGSLYPLAPDDLIQLDTPDAAFRAQANALVEVWQELCQWAATLPDPETARQTLHGCLDMMQRAIHRQARRWHPTPDHATATLNPARTGVRHIWRSRP